jgi:hypothetical protein
MQLWAMQLWWSVSGYACCQQQVQEGQAPVEGVGQELCTRCALGAALLLLTQFWAVGR